MNKTKSQILEVKLTRSHRNVQLATQ